MQTDAARRPFLDRRRHLGTAVHRLVISQRRAGSGEHVKGVLGHPFGASGAFQTAAAALAMQHSLIPHTHNLEEPAPECDLDLVMGEPRPATIRHALFISYGYGGINTYLLLRNPHA